MPQTRVAALAAAAFIAAGCAGASAEPVAVVDAADLQRLGEAFPAEPTNSHRDLVGTPLFSKIGSRLGVIEDFVIGEDGQLYAVIALEEVLGIADYEEGDAVVRWSEVELGERPVSPD